MTTLIAIIGFFLLPINEITTISDHLGTWNYEVEAPDMVYKGTMILKEEDGEYKGSMTSQGITIPLTDMEIDGDEISFKMNVQGFMCTVAGEFDGESVSGTVSVQGMSLPLKGTKAE